MIRLDNTDAHEINETLSKLHKGGQVSSGQVLTLVIDTDPNNYEKALADAREAGMVHPSRILVAIRGCESSADGDDPNRPVCVVDDWNHEQEPGLTAWIDDELSSTEVIALRFVGDVDEHAESVLLPLLLPELPVVLWYPRYQPGQTCPLDGLTDRIISDSTTADDPVAMLHHLAIDHPHWSTDLAWTRITRWRAMLVAALDQVRAEVLSGTVYAEPDNAPSYLMQAWLELQLGVEIKVEPPDHKAATYSPDILGLHGVILETRAGTVNLRRITTTEAVLQLPGQPDRQVALARRTIQEQLLEELTRLSGDQPFDDVMDYLAVRNRQ